MSKTKDNWIKFPTLIFSLLMISNIFHLIIKLIITDNKSMDLKDLNNSLLDEKTKELNLINHSML